MSIIYRLRLPLISYWCKLGTATCKLVLLCSEARVIFTPSVARMCFLLIPVLTYLQASNSIWISTRSPTMWTASHTDQSLSTISKAHSSPPSASTEMCRLPYGLELSPLIATRKATRQKLSFIWYSKFYNQCDRVMYFFSATVWSPVFISLYSRVLQYSRSVVSYGGITSAIS